MQLRTKILSVLLLAAAFNSTALNLGRVRGAALVGQPLDLTIQAQLAPDESANSLCVEADVFHADTRQDPNRVRVSVEAGQQQTANIRVTSSSPIDEPVVTIYLKAGCNQKITRRYVMLADVPTEAAPPAPQMLPLVTAPAAVSPAAPVTSAASSPVSPSTDTGGATQGVPPLPATATTPSGRPAPAPKRAAAPAKPRPALKKPAQKQVEKATPQVVEKPVDKPVDKTAEKPPAPAKTEAVAKPAPAKEDKPPAAKEAAPAKTKIDEKMTAGREAGQSRLKLDPLVTLAERVATLETTQSAPSAEAMRDAQKVKALEDSVKTLVALAAKNEANMLEMRSQLQKAEAERLPMVWLYLLGGALLVSLAALAYLLTRRRSGSAADGDDWWSGSKAAGSAAAGSAPSATTVAPSVHSQLRDSMPASLATQNSLKTTAVSRPNLRDDPESEIDVSLVEMSESNFDNLMQSGQSHGALRRGPLPPATDNSMATRAQPMELTRSINSEEIFDIRQQADFFVSLGQTDQAVRILENRINESGESSPLLYLDLLKIFHSLGLKQDYHQFREDFNLLFNSRVPEFSQYKEEGRSLEDYPQVLAHITALWATPKAQMVIEASIFRDPMDDKSKPFDLAAFRDLLLLHAVGQSNARGDSGVSGLAPLSTVPVSPQKTTSITAKLSGAMSVDIPLESPVSVMPPVPEGDLDLDLSDLVLPEPTPKTATASKTAAAPKPKAPEPLAEEDTEFPKLITTPFATTTPVPAASLPPAAASSPTVNKSGPPVQAIEDDNFLDFDKQATVKYTLPKNKDGGKA